MNRHIPGIATILLILCTGCATPEPTQPVVAARVYELQDTYTEAIPSATAIPSTETPVPTATGAPTPTLTQPLPTPTALTLAPCIRAGAQPQTGQVTSIVDGDTIQVTIDGQAYTVRYIGLDAPENTTIQERFGPEAAEANRRLVEGQTVTLFKDVSETDRNGRLLRYVYAGETFVNEALLRRGLAITVSYPPDDACLGYFLTAQQEANSKRSGLWSKPNPTQTPLGLGAENNSDKAICNCDGPDRDCNDFKNHNAAQACYNYCFSLGLGDIFRLDDSVKDGKVCESLP